MSYTIKKLPKSLVQIEVEVPLADMQRPLESAAKHLSEHKPIEGFRPGKVPYDVVKARYGEMAIYEEAADEIVKRTYLHALQEEEITSVAAPEIKIIQLVPGSPLKYEAKVAVLPTIKVGDFSKVKVSKKVKEVANTDIEKVLKDLQRLRASQTVVDRPAALGDKLTTSIQMFLDKVPLEGGQARKQEVLLGENFYVPGFSEALVGIKRGETREFTLEYPKDAQEKKLAGRKVEFKVEVADVFEVKQPELNDEFAKSLGKFESLAGLKEKVKENVGLEFAHEADRQSEEEMLKVLVTASEFGELPEVLIKGEIERATQELEQDLQKQGLGLTDYLAHLHKTKEQLEKELVPQAERRLRVALLLRQISQLHDLLPTTEEIDQYLQGWAGYTAKDPQATARLSDPGFRDYAKNILANQKVLDFLKKQCVG